MNFQIDDITVYFPFPRIYPEQYAYMRSLKSALDAPRTVCARDAVGHWQDCDAALIYSPPIASRVLTVAN
jgi:Rad3-related DNA helicase